MNGIGPAQEYMKEHGIDGWLLYDFRGNNPVFARALGGKTRATSRRSYCFIPNNGTPTLLVHGLDHLLFTDVDARKVQYTSWQEMAERLEALMQRCTRIAMEYSPFCAIPMNAWVDAGTVELVRKLGKEVVPSADLFQMAYAAWSEEALRAHLRACGMVATTKDAAFAKIGEKLTLGESVTEYTIQQFIRQRFAEHRLVTDHGPIVAVNAHSGDPHYEPSEESAAPIQRGDWVLIDLWAKEDGPNGVYSDITWVGYCGEQAPDKHQRVFNVVRQARDEAVDAVQQAWHDGDTIKGWQADQVARDVIIEAGYGKYFTHRTGHSMGISPTPHALGVNLDNLETHDTRAILPGVGFSVEPGIYLPEEFGVRLEIDVYVHPQGGPTVTTPVQEEIILIG